MILISFLNDYKANSDKLVNLISWKISLGISIISYISLEKYIIEYILIDHSIYTNLYLDNIKKTIKCFILNFLIKYFIYKFKLSQIAWIDFK